MSRAILGGVEAGGTKMVCAVAYEPGEILDEVRFPTAGPVETLERVQQYFSKMECQYGALEAIGYGTFGPAVVNSSSAGYGTILNTPKTAWKGADVLGFLADAFPRAKLAFDTDVNAAALGEGVGGAARGLENFIYVTVGTGIGGGVVVGGKPLKTSPHAEIGHMLVPVADGEVAGFAGSCPFHGGCLEGLASGSALKARWGIPAYELEPDHGAWKLEARYLAGMVQNLLACHAPEKIILGGGVMEQEFLLDMVVEDCTGMLAGYWPLADDLLVRPELGNKAGITGALVMASTA